MNHPSPQKSPSRKTGFASKFQWLFLIALLLLAGLYFLLQGPRGVGIRYGDLKQLLRDSSVTFQEVEVTRAEIRGKLTTRDRVFDGEAASEMSVTLPFVTARGGLENDQELQQLLDARVGGYDGQAEDSGLRLLYYSVLPPIFLILIGVGIFLFIRWMSGGSLMGIGRSRAKLHAKKDLQITFDDVAGIDEAVEELREVVDFLKNPQKYQVLGGRIPKGVLLVGPPGTGKTLLAKAVAGEAHAPFFSMSGSDFVEMFVGLGAARVRDVFDQAENKAPCIIFIDELDALGKTRSGAVVGAHDEREQTLNQLLVEMDGFDTDRGVIIMAATNRPETLDPALLRPGRFDRTVVVDRPDINGREAILKVHARHVKLAADINLRHIAALTPGFVGADLANLVNEAALMAARRGRAEVVLADLEEAIERCVAGLEKKKRIMHPDEKQRVAYHECGHALVACVLPNTDPVHKVSIIPRGIAALGYTMQRPEDDRYLVTKSELLSQIKVLLGGSAAEELVYGETSTGAQNDLERASRIARNMVTQFGMSKLGRVNFHEQGNSVFLGGGNGAAEQHYSEQTAREIDLEVRRIIDEANLEVKEILDTRGTCLEAVAQRLMEKEVMDGAELKEILEQHHPGPHLVPGSTPMEPRATENEQPAVPDAAWVAERRAGDA